MLQAPASSALQMGAGARKGRRGHDGSGARDHPAARAIGAPRFELELFFLSLYASPAGSRDA